MKKMKKGLLVFCVVLAIALTAAADAGAQARLEVNGNWPLLVSLGSGSPLGDVGSIDLSKYFLIVPDFRAYYQFGQGMLRGGIGVRVPTLIIVSMVYPEAFVELDLHPVVLEASVGGLLFGAFGLGVSSLRAEPWVTPDLNVSFEIADWFRLGGGVYLIAPLDGSWGQNYLSIVYIGARLLFFPK